MPFDPLKRREFITLIAGAAVAWPLAARAQQPPMPVIGYFSGRSPEAEAPLRTPFLKALETSGFTVGRNRGRPVNGQAVDVVCGAAHGGSSIQRPNSGAE